MDVAVPGFKFGKMAVFLTSTKLKQTAVSNKLLPSYVAASTPRQLTDIPSEGGSNKKTLHSNEPISQRESSLLNSDFGHASLRAQADGKNLEVEFASPSHKALDLPSWTPLTGRTLGYEQESGQSPASSHPSPVGDELLISAETAAAIGSATKPLPVHSAPVTVQQMPEASFHGKPLSKGKTARFDGIVITSKPPGHGKHKFQPSTRRPPPAAVPSTPGTQGLSLVDALARTFDANRHIEGPLLPATHTGRDRYGSAIRPMDVESTETEDEQLRLNTRLAPKSLKRGLTRASARAAASVAASETNSEDASPFQEALRPERPTKRLKSILYDSNAALIDAALGTALAPITWDYRLDITADETTSTEKDAIADSPASRMSVNESERRPLTGPLGTFPNIPCQDYSATDGENAPPFSLARGPARPVAVLTPYLSRGAKFRQRLQSMFGKNATVRKDKAAQPRPADLELFDPFEGLDRESSPSASDSPASGAASASRSGSDYITSRSLPAEATGTYLLYENQPNGMDSLTKTTVDAGEEQLNGWVAALQRLVKGKVRIKEEDLEVLSIVLAEIESVKDSLDETMTMTLELFGALKRVSELHEIPFGDRNKLRQRAANIVDAWLSVGKPGAS